MGTIPILGMDLCPRDISLSLLYTFQSGDQSESEPMENSCIVQESMSKSEPESESGHGNKPLDSRKFYAIVSVSSGVQNTPWESPNVCVGVDASQSC